MKCVKIDRAPQQWYESFVLCHRMLGFLTAHGRRCVIRAEHADKRVGILDTSEHALLPICRELDVFAVKPAFAFLLRQCLGEPLRE